MAGGDTARLYHRLSSYGPNREWPTAPPEHPLVLQDFVGNDFATWPPQVKAYADELPVVGAAARLACPGRARDRRARRHGPRAGEADLCRRSRACCTCRPASCARARAATGAPLLFRAAGSAGGRFPLELYVSARGVDGLADGVHWYDPVGHALLQVGPPAGGEATTLIVTGIPWRTGWRYAERGFRHIYWDAGTMLAQTLALAGPGALFTRFPDAQVTRLVGADGVHEFPVALVALEDGAPAIEPGGARRRPARIDERPVEFPLVTQAQRAGDGDVLGAPWPAAPPLDGEPPASRDLDAVILQRGSTRLMDASRDAPARRLRVLAAPPRCAGSTCRTSSPSTASRTSSPGSTAGPTSRRRCGAGNLRDELLVACWDQDLGRDAAFVVMGAIDIDELDDRGYREAQLAAGHRRGPPAPRRLRARASARPG